MTKITSTGVYCTDPLPPGGRRLTKGAPVKKAEGGVMAIGCFVDRDGTEYILPVNRSFNAKITAKLTMGDWILSAAEISQETGKPLAAVETARQPIDVTLDPGEGRLFVLKSKGR